MNLKQAWIIMKTAWQRNLNYRFSVMAYRVGEMVEVLVVVLMWTAIYSNEMGTIKGFSMEEMITYVLVGNLCAVAARNFLTSYVSRDIELGRLSTFLIKPISYIKYVFVNELGRMFLSTIISVTTQAAIIVFFANKIVFNTDIRYLGIIVVMVFLAFIMELLLSFSIGMIAFWTDEVDGIYTTIERVKRFFAGGYFPLSLLPASLAVASSYLPFAYSFFIPAQLYLKKIDLAQGIKGLVVQVVWIILLSLILAFIWKRGLKRYEATGM
ncbi:MAG: ABC-2 family transporter protein [Patescibacteria group bacterium]